MTVIASTLPPLLVSHQEQVVPDNPPPAPAPPPAPTPQPTGYQLPGGEAVVPLPREQLSALEKRADELSDLIKSVQSRRAGVADELEGAKLDINRSGLEERLRFLDQRIMTLEQEIDANSSARTSLEAAYTTIERDDDGSTFTAGNFDGLIAFAVLFPISLAIARSIWRRSSRRSIQAAIPQAEARFAQLEQSIDTVAVEIERVAEGQRYVTRLLREGQPLPDFSNAQGADPLPARARAEDAR